MIRFFAKDNKFNLPSKLVIKKWIKQVISQYGYRTGDLNVIFCTDPNILEINRQFLQHDYYTDIITFDYTEDGLISGELYISIDTVKANAEEYRQTFMDELHRVIIHGILHMVGLDDHTPEQTAQMRKGENEALALLETLFEPTQKQ